METKTKVLLVCFAIGVVFLIIGASAQIDGLMITAGCLIGGVLLFAFLRYRVITDAGSDVIMANLQDILPDTELPEVSKNTYIKTDNTQ